MLKGIDIDIRQDLSHAFQEMRWFAMLKMGNIERILTSGNTKEEVEKSLQTMVDAEYEYNAPKKRYLYVIRR